MSTLPAGPIRVVVVDDHAMVRRGLASFLKTSADLQLVGEAANGEEAIRLCDEILPDVVLMDMLMPVMNGADATRAICRKHPHMRVIVLTSYKDGEQVRNALEAGAIGYLIKDVSGEDLVRAIRAAHVGRATLSPDVAQTLVEAANQPPPPGLNLTEREHQVLAAMVEGLNNKQIAEKLIVSLSTVKSHVSNILMKLGITSRTEAVSIALRSHMLP